MQKSFDLTGKVAVVTGGTGVLGGEMAWALAEAGARVAILGRRKERAIKLATAIEKNGGSAMPLPADVLVKESLEDAKNKVLKKWGTIDILVNSAGGNVAGAVVSPEQSIIDLKEDDLRMVIELNQMGTILPTVVFCSTMIEKKSGIVVNISSMAAQSAITRVMGYSTAKAAVDIFTKWMAVEMAQKYGEGIRVNAIAPGFFITEQNRDLLLDANKNFTSRAEKILTNTPMGRFGKPDELKGTLIWLCSDASKFITGIVVPVDGGFSAYSGV